MVPAYHNGGGEVKVGTAAEKVRKRRLEWLGHLARMLDHLIPKSPLPRAHPRYVAQRKGGEIIMVKKDWKDVGVDEVEHYMTRPQGQERDMQVWVRDDSTGPDFHLIRGEVVCVVYAWQALPA
jgi:hypothetical protein